LPEKNREFSEICLEKSKFFPVKIEIFRTFAWKNRNFFDPDPPIFQISNQNDAAGRMGLYNYHALGLIEYSFFAFRVSWPIFLAVGKQRMQFHYSKEMGQRFILTVVRLNCREFNSK